MHNLRLRPCGCHLSYLTQGHTLPRRSGQIGIPHLTEFHVLGRSVLHHNGYLIVALPNASHLHLTCLERQLKLSQRAIDAQLGRCNRVEVHFHDGMRLVIIGVHPLDARDATHFSHQHLGSTIQTIEILAIETIFVGRHIEKVHLLETHIGIRPMVAPLGCIVV